MEAGSFIAPIGSAGALNATLLYCPVLATEPEGRLAAIVDSRSTLTQGRFNRRRCDGESARGTGRTPHANCVAGSTARQSGSRSHWASRSLSLDVARAQSPIGRVA